MRLLLVLTMIFTLSATAQINDQNYDRIAAEMVSGLRIELATVPGTQLKTVILDLVFEAADEEERAVDELLVTEIERLDLRSTADLGKLQPLLAASLKRTSEAN